MKRLVPLALLWMLLEGFGQVDSERLLRHRNLGKAFYENPTTEAEAVEEFRKALELAPGSLRERLNYGLALLRANRADEGAAELEKVQQQDPGIPHTWFNLGVVYRKRGEHAHAMEQFQRMVQLVPEEPVSHYNLGSLYKYAGDIAGALREFETAAALDPNFVAPLYQIFTVHREQGHEAEAARAMERFLEVRQRHQRQEGPDAAPEDTNWSAYSEIYETIDPESAAREVAPPAELKFDTRKLAGKADPKTAGMLTLDAFGDARVGLLVWSAEGILFFRDGSERVDVGLADVKNVTSVAPGDYDNDGLPDLCVLTNADATLYLNSQGKFRRQTIKLPTGRFNKALWLDYDHDYDVDLFLFGERPVLFRNQGAAGFEDRTADFPFAPGEALDAAVFRLVPDSKASDVAVTYRDRSGVLYCDKLAGSYEAAPIDAIPAGAAAIVPFDIDNNGSIDLVFRSPSGLRLLLNRKGALEPDEMQLPSRSGFAFADLENRAMGDIVAGDSVFRNEALGRFAGAKPAAGLVEGVVWAEADFDRDGRSDLAAVAADGSLHLLTNRTASKDHWLGVRLTGVRNMKLAPGAEVEIKAGGCYQKKIYQGVPLSFGTRTHKQLDTVRITWPNGMIQNATRQATGRFEHFQEAPRLSGSCPMIFTWNGRQFEFITDVLGVAPLGASSGDGRFFPVDHDEYIWISGEALIPVNGKYEIRITEELSEVTYLDKVQLIALDHPREVAVFSNDKWKGPPFPDFQMFGVKHRVYPKSARDEAGRDLLRAISRRDRVYADGFRRNQLGVAEMHSLELDFGDAVPDNRAILVLHGWVDWADGSAFRAAAQESAGGLVPPYLQMKDARGRWKTVIEDMGIPSGKTKTIAVDLTDKFLGDSREIRMVTNLCVYWDEIFLGEDASPPQVRLTPADAQTARFRFRGFSRPRIDPQRKQPEYFDYEPVAPVSMWNPTPGFYTRYGEVRELLASADDRFVIMGSGDELRLSFDAAGLPRLPQGWKRDFLLLVDGWAKDRDANTAFSQTVEPLPFHAMSSYPYPATEKYPDDPAHESYRAAYNTRPALRLIRPLTGSRTALRK